MSILDFVWLTVRDGDERAFSIFKNHYSFHHYADGRRQRYGYRNRFLMLGPGEKLLLMTPQCDAIFGWRRFVNDDGQRGVNCAFFRNESQMLSSAMILEAEKLAWAKWPDETRLYTYVDPRAVQSANPGYCFKMAGWSMCGITKIRKLVILEKIRN